MSSCKIALFLLFFLPLVFAASYSGEGTYSLEVGDSVEVNGTQYTLRDLSSVGVALRVYDTINNIELSSWQLALVGESISIHTAQVQVIAVDVEDKLAVVAFKSLAAAVSPSPRPTAFPTILPTPTPEKIVVTPLPAKKYLPSKKYVGKLVNITEVVEEDELVCGACNGAIPKECRSDIEKTLLTVTNFDLFAYGENGLMLQISQLETLKSTLFGKTNLVFL